MTINAALPQLAETLMRYRFAYLVTMGDEARTHVVPVHATLANDRLLVRGLGQKTHANIAAHPAVTLVWPPMDPSDYSVIVDGVGSIRDEELAVAPTQAVLHRPAQSHTTTTGEGCQSDCVELARTAEIARR